ncbi:MAG: ATP-binding protein [Candidatus Geothermincolia bacterium]
MTGYDPGFPFSAILGQSRLKRALLVNATNHAAGGLLVRGERGTGKSTAARALAALLPEIDVVEACPFSCHPHDIGQMCDSCAGLITSGRELGILRRRVEMVTLPLNATEDRISGTFDIELALKEGETRFEPGVLARANRGILYIDEVNLLEDHLVDLLLDAAAMGVNTVEREGISFRHPSRFIIIATMNPEEGDLRPQLEDRFGLSVDVRGEKDVGLRSEILRRRKRFADNPLLFASEFQGPEDDMRQAIATSRAALDDVRIEDDMLDLIACLAVEAGASGHRGDIAMMNTALSLAALASRRAVERPDVLEAAKLALPHRCQGKEQRERLEQLVERVGLRAGAGGKEAETPVPPTSCQEGSGTSPSRDEPVVTQAETAAKAPELPKPVMPRRSAAAQPGKRQRGAEGEDRGRYVGHRVPDEIPGSLSSIALDATLRAAAARTGAGKLTVSPADLRTKVKRRRSGSLVIFVLDASASMHAGARMEAAQGAMLALLEDAYQKRDRIGMVVFKDDLASVVVPPTSSVSLARAQMEGVSSGGATPLAHGLALGLEVMTRELARRPDLFPVMVVITDGRGNVSLSGADPMAESLQTSRSVREAGISSLVIDTAPDYGEASSVTTPARRIADALGAEYCALEHCGWQPLADRVAGRLS